MQNVMKIRKLRFRACITIPELAVSMGVAPRGVKDWECERYLPHARQLPLLAQVLGCEINDLYEEGA